MRTATIPRLRSAALLLAVSTLAACGSGESRPHLVLIIVDTLRADAVLDPRDEVETPNLDALTREGVGFTSAFAHAPMTLPSHTALFSSRLPFQSGVLNNGQPVPESLPLLAEWMDRYGYESRAVLSLGTLVSHGAQAPGLERGFTAYDTRFWNLAPAEDVEVRTRASLEEWGGDGPLFLFSHFSDPHEPYDSHQEDGRSVEIRLNGEVLGHTPTSNMDPFKRSLTLPAGDHLLELSGDHDFRVRVARLESQGQRLPVEWEEGAVGKVLQGARGVTRVSAEQAGELDLTIWVNDSLDHATVRERYYREVEHADRYVGRVLDALREAGIYDDSLIVFTSDHGEALGEHGRVGHVEALTDEMIHVPLIVKLPLGHPRTEELGTLAGRLVRHVDLVPTVLELLGVPPLEGARGSSLFSGPAGVHFAETHEPEAKSDKLALRDQAFKMIFLADEDRFVMYDLGADPAEATDVFASRSSERPEWPGQLRDMAAVALDRTRKPGEITPELEGDLDALGY